MKNSTFYSVAVTGGFLAALMLAGCGAAAENSAPAPSQATVGKSAPPQAQSLATQQQQQKSQMDAMRAKGAAKTAQ